MKDILYYYERRTKNGRLLALDDAIVKRVLINKYPDLLCIYRESDTQNGQPFIMVWERSS